MIQPHFQIGQRLVIENKRYHIFDYNDDKVVLIPLDETGPIRVEQPYYMQWKTR